MGTITFIQDELTVPIEPGTKLVDIAQESGSGVPFGCTNGICGTCLSRITKGRELLNTPSEQEKDTLALFGASEGHRLVCQCRLEKDGDVEIDGP